MIARHRGDLRAHSRWRPSTPVVPAPAPTTTDDHDLHSERSDELFSEQHDLDLPRSTQRKPRALIAIATIVAIAVIAGQQHSAPVTRRSASALYSSAMGVSVDSRDASEPRRGLQPPVRAGAHARVHWRHRPQLHLVLHLGEEHLLPHPPRARRRAHRGRRSPGARRWAQVGLLHDAPQPRQRRLASRRRRTRRISPRTLGAPHPRSRDTRRTSSTAPRPPFVSRVYRSRGLFVVTPSVGQQKRATARWASTWWLLCSWRAGCHRRRAADRNSGQALVRCSSGWPLPCRQSDQPPEQSGGAEAIVCKSCARKAGRAQVADECFRHLDRNRADDPKGDYSMFARGSRGRRVAPAGPVEAAGGRGYSP